MVYYLSICFGSGFNFYKFILSACLEQCFNIPPEFDTTGLWELCRESRQAAFAGVDLPWLSQTKGAAWVKGASCFSRDYSSPSTCVPGVMSFTAHSAVP